MFWLPDIVEFIVVFHRFVGGRLRRLAPNRGTRLRPMPGERLVGLHQAC